MKWIVWLAIIIAGFCVNEHITSQCQYVWGIAVGGFAVITLSWGR
jgi:hypothetical protein